MRPERCAGVLVPVFSIRTAGSWGLGELPDLARLAPWMRSAGLRVVMTLPLLEVALGQTSPYSALSAFALEPSLLSLDDVEDFREARRRGGAGGGRPRAARPPAPGRADRLGRRLPLEGPLAAQEL
ncbi:MAG: 4-alpha-glucanotransferase [Myxococcales bacterium]